MLSKCLCIPTYLYCEDVYLSIDRYRYTYAPFVHIHILLHIIIIYILYIITYAYILVYVRTVPMYYVIHTYLVDMWRWAIPENHNTAFVCTCIYYHKFVRLYLSFQVCVRVAPWERCASTRVTRTPRRATDVGVRWDCRVGTANRRPPIKVTVIHNGVSGCIASSKHRTHGQNSINLMYITLSIVLHNLLSIRSEEYPFLYWSLLFSILV